MFRLPRWQAGFILTLIYGLSACGVVSSRALQSTRVPSTPTVIDTRTIATPMPTAISMATRVIPSATSIPTQEPPTPTVQPRPTVAASGAQSAMFGRDRDHPIFGEVLGSGTTAVIFSVMGSCKPGWTHLAQEVADRGYRVLTYRWHACLGAEIDQREIQLFVDDTRDAIHYMRDQGAQRVILVGASLGGCASAKLLAESQADGLVVVASPSAITDWGFSITATDLKSSAPKLFITSEDDATVPAAATRKLYELATAPREWQTYPGVAHGTDIFEGEYGPALSARILTFIDAIAQS